MQALLVDVVVMTGIVVVAATVVVVAALVTGAGAFPAAVLVLLTDGEVIAGLAGAAAELVDELVVCVLGAVVTTPEAAATACHTPPKLAIS